MSMNKETLKKVSPVVIGVIIAAAGVLVAFGVLKPTVKQVVPVAAGQKIEFTAETNAVMVKADVQVIIGGTNYFSGDCWVLYRMTPPASVVPVVHEVSVPLTPVAIMAPVATDVTPMTPDVIKK